MKRGETVAKLRLGTIGTSGITEQFIEAAINSGKYSLEAVYSRTQDRALLFEEKFKALKAYTDWEVFLNDPEIDVIYIASPNSLHFEQAKQVLIHQKHAIVEKPIVTSLPDLDRLIDLARQNNKVVVEAARHLYEPNFMTISKWIKNLPRVYGASLTYSKYSSRYDEVLKGGEPAIFSPNFDGGAVNDLGIYVVYAAIHWFGKPQGVHAFIQKVETGVDGKGMALLRYPDFDVTLNFGKINTSLHSTEIYGPDQTLILDGVTGLSEATLIDARTKEAQKLNLEEPAANPLSWEANEFADLILNFQKEESKVLLNKRLTLSRNVHEVLEQIRRHTK